MTGKMKKILEEIHPLHIIREVQKWPALYVKDCPERANTHFKLKIWCEVAKELFPDWDTFTKAEKDKKISDLMKKWRNLRDTFKRQVEIERKVREGHDIKKKMYVYYNHMAFLHPHIAGDSDGEEPAAAASVATAAAAAAATAAPTFASAAARRRKLKHRSDPKIQLGDTPATSASVFLEEIDEDKHFLMSLIPSLKKMTEDEKLTVKVEILKAIKNVRANSSNFSYQVVDSLAYNTELEVIRGDDDIKKEIFAELEPVGVDVDLAQASSDEDSN